MTLHQISDEIAEDTWSELVAKTTEAIERLSNTNADKRFVSRLRYLLTVVKPFGEDPDFASLLNIEMSIYVDTIWMCSGSGVAETFPAVIAIYKDVWETLRDYLACYPEARTIAARLSVPPQDETDTQSA